ncbi:MAG: riboflavin synthase [Actinomycetota bacterium]
MFTGIIEATGRVARVSPLGVEVESGIGADGEPLRLGDSIAVNGVCLTVTSTEGGRFTADLSEETLRRTALGRLEAGSTVNLERPMRADGRFGGHIVQGHVDGVATVTRVEQQPGSTEVWFSLADPHLRFLVEKGSVTVDGASLTVASLVGGGFSVALIPHTLAATTLGVLAPGSVVNVEVDIVAKYVQRLLPPVVPALTRLGSAAATALGEDPLGPRAVPLSPRREEPELRAVRAEASLGREGAP